MVIAENDTHHTSSYLTKINQYELCSDPSASKDVE